MTEIKNNDSARVKYSGYVFEGSKKVIYHQNEVLKFKLGTGTVITGFEQAVIGMKVGETKKIEIPAELGFGRYKKELLVELSKKKFPLGKNPEIGMHMEILDHCKKPISAVIKEIKQDTILLDANHPLAGKTLFYELELLQIVENKSEEIKLKDSSHQPGCTKCCCRSKGE